MSYTTNNGVRIYWDEQGSGTTVLLVMGHAFPSEMWHPVIPALVKKHRVIWFDNRGTGRSDAPTTATISDLAGDARAVLDAAGVDRAHVYGVSMGGGVTLQLAHETPERVISMVLGCTALKTESLPVKSRAALLRYYIPLRLLRGAMRKSMYGPACSPEAAERDLDVLCATKVRPRGLMAQVKAMESYDLTADKVATLAMPALVLHGDADTTVDVARGKELADVLPDSRLVIYPGVGHSFPVAVTDQANADVLGFFSDVDSLVP
jgi:pimeloyl-ACP methyl ester carboxylesterase